MWKSIMEICWKGVTIALYTEHSDNGVYIFSHTNQFSKH